MPFLVFGMTRPGIEPRSPGLLANTLPTGPMIREVLYILQSSVTGASPSDCLASVKLRNISL